MADERLALPGCVRAAVCPSWGLLRGRSQALCSPHGPGDPQRSPAKSQASSSSFPWCQWQPLPFPQAWRNRGGIPALRGGFRTSLHEGLFPHTQICQVRRVLGQGSRESSPISKSHPGPRQGDQGLSSVRRKQTQQHWQAAPGISRFPGFCSPSRCPSHCLHA